VINGYTCGNGTLTSPMNCIETCGDGFITHTEVCDDGNTVSGDGCLSDCSATEPGFNCDAN